MGRYSRNILSANGPLVSKLFQRPVRVLSVLGFCLWFGIPTIAAATLTDTSDLSTPANDACSGATVIHAIPFTDTLSTTGATTVPGDPLQSCTTDGPSQNSRSVWYSFTPAASGMFVADTLGSTYDTVLSVYTGTCQTLVELACDDDAGLSSQSRLSFSAESGQTVLLEATAFGQADGGTLILNVALAPSAPAKDSCSEATVIPEIPFTDTVLTAGATTDPNDPLQSCTFDGPSQNSRSVWYSFTPTAAGTFVVDTLGSTYDTVLSAYTGTCRTPVELACNDDVGLSSQSRLSFSAESGETVLLEATAFGQGDGGTLILNVALAPSPPANDACSEATVIPAIPFTDTVSTVGATTAPNDPLQSCTFGGPSQNFNSVWYGVTATADGTLVANTYGSSYDTVLTAYTGTCAQLAALACNDDGKIGPQSEISFPVTSGQTVLLDVTQYGGPGGGTLVLNVFAGAPPTLPCVGDCNGDGMVAVDEILTMVSVALGASDHSACMAGDANGDDLITINEIITAVNNSLAECPGGGLQVQDP
jgi:hypothetical protein